MQIFKKPWFLILILIASVYTYQFYRTPQTMKVSFSQAGATNQTDAEEVAKSDADEKPVVEVNISESFTAENIKSFALSTYLDLKLKFAKTTGPELIVSLIGSGQEYKGEGKEIKDWFDVSSKNGQLTVKSPSKAEYKGLSSLKEMAKALRRENGNKLTLIVEFPEGHKFDEITLETVFSDIFAKDLNFKKFKSIGVSSEIRLQRSVGESLTVETVSGDSEFEVGDLKQAKFVSASGDVILTATGVEPRLDFESISGDLSLILPKDSEIDVNFESMTGELSNDFGISKKATSQLKFSSLSGDAKVTKLTK